MQFKVLCPIERNGKTFWVRSGTAFTNKDSSINIYLDVLPSNGKLQLREFDERDRERIQPRPDDGAAASGNDALPF
jgi:hypothetical protein